jgi:hypothetical protein
MRKIKFSNMVMLILLGFLSGCGSDRNTAQGHLQPQSDWDASEELRRLASITNVECMPAPDLGKTQHIIGYGSLMQEQSRTRTAPSAGPASPVLVNGYRRGWFAKGGSVGFDTTYLGVIPDAHSTVNAVLYRIRSDDLLATDQREYFYCRRLVNPSEITFLVDNGMAAQGQIWIYTNQPDSLGIPSARYPLVQSYIDIFVSGCLETEQRHGLTGFAQQCLVTTTGWSSHWVNDRIYPRRPLAHQPRAHQIDKLLSENLPQYFRTIRLEAVN